LFVAPAHRRQGVCRALVSAASIWVAAEGCSEFASDSLVENVDAHAVHRALGFVETERVVYFCKALAMS
jgi:aminoglycoside 6'-N-acetyltransferase I